MQVEFPRQSDSSEFSHIAEETETGRFRVGTSIIKQKEIDHELFLAIVGNLSHYHLFCTSMKIHEELLYDWKESEEVTRVLPDFVKKARSRQSAFSWLQLKPSKIYEDINIPFLVFALDKLNRL